jgi:hypothetical protein
MALDGRLCLALKPKQYTERISYWKEHPDTNELNEIVKNVEKIAYENKMLNAEKDKETQKEEKNTNNDNDEDEDENYSDESDEDADYNEMKYLKDELESDE